MLEAMRSGWAKQQRGGRRLQPRTIAGREAIVRQFVEFTNEYPWRWTAHQVDEWFTDLIAAQGKAESTLRNYQSTLRMFCEYLVSPHYGWSQECEARFGSHPVQVCHEWNTVAHLTDYEGRADRRPLTRTELQWFFDHADDQVGKAVRRGRKGALTAYRDAFGAAAGANSALSAAQPPP